MCFRALRWGLQVCLIGFASYAQAQVVKGTVVAADTTLLVHGAVVLLLDTAGTRQGASFTGDNGAFYIKAPVAARYRLQIQRIGFHTVDSDFFDVAAGATINRRIEVALRPVELPPIMAAAKRQCTGQRSGDAATAAVWQEARKGLVALLLSESQSTYRFQLRRFRRRIDPQTARVLSDSSRERISYAVSSPFVSPPVDQLLDQGFIEKTDSGTFYHAPDARVLTSTAFGNAYCFHASEDSSSALIGVSFMPMTKSAATAITGTLWLGRADLQLRRLEFNYVGMALPEAANHRLGGFLHFVPMPNGAPIVHRWSIRMPVLAESETRFPSGVQKRTRIVGVIEDGGEVIDASLASDHVRANSATITVRIYDWETKKPISSASLLLPALNINALSDVDGRVTLHAVPFGQHQIRTAHIAYPAHVDTVRVSREQLTFDIGIPGAAMPIAPVVAKAMSHSERARRTRGSRSDLLLREQLEPLERSARHIGDLVRHIPGLKVREMLHGIGGLLKGICIESRRGAVTLQSDKRNCSSVLVVLDGMPLQQSNAPMMRDWQAEALVDLSPHMIESIEFLPAAEAGPRYGAGSENGVIVIFTRGNGPHAKPRN